MCSFKAWRQRRLLARHPLADSAWAAVLAQLPILAGLDAAEEQRLRRRVVLFLHAKRLTALPGVSLDDPVSRLEILFTYLAQRKLVI